MTGTGVGVLIKSAYANGWRRTPETYPGRFATVDEACQFIRENFVYVRTENAYLDANGVRLSVEALNRSCARLMPKSGDKASARADYIASEFGCIELADRVGYGPGEARIYLDNGIRLANTYRPWEPQPLEPTEQEKQMLERHRIHLVNGEQDAEDGLNYINQCFAYLVQNPRSRIPKGLLIIGSEEGSGKSTQMLEIPRRLFGWNNVSAVGNNEINSDFNPYMFHRIVVFEEIWQVKQTDALKKANDLKPLITDARVRIVAKGKDGFEVRNITTILATSNHIDAINVSNSDRRWAIMETCAKAMPKELAEELYSFLNSERAPGVLRYIYGRMDVSEFNPHVAPTSQAKQRAKEVSRSDWEQAIIDAYSSNSGCFARDIVSLMDVKKQIELVLNRSVTMNHVTKSLQAAPLNAKEINATKSVDGKTKGARGWIIRNHDLWLNGKTKAECYDELTPYRVGPIL